jgi:acetyl-CoA carboxylase carboxyltransferase component
MDVIETRIDTQSDEYQRNYAHMRELVTELHQNLETARRDRSSKAYERHTSQGKLPIRERVKRLLDPGTPFLETAPLAAFGMYDGRVHGAGIVSGVGVVHGREFYITGNDAMVKGGSFYPLTVKKSLRDQEIAMTNRLPMINMIDSAGAYLPLQSDIFADKHMGGRVFYNQALMSKMGLPQIAIVMGQCTAGGAYAPAMSTFVIMVKGTGGIFLGGPPLVRAATGEVVSADELGGADVHCAQSGVADFYAENDDHALHIARDLALQVNLPHKMPVPTREPRPPIYDPDEIYGILPVDIAQPYDVREVIARLVDASELEEFKALWGTTLVTGFAYIHGYKVGILANQGVLFSESALKGAQFIQICDSLRIPLVFLQNIMGFIIGREYEARGITKDGHKMVAAVACATVPKLTVMIGGSFGAGNYAMCGRAYDPRWLWVWPNHRISVMGGKQAADVLVTVKQDQLAREGQQPMPEDFVDAMRQPVIETYEKEGNAYASTARLWDDGILDPKKTRDALGLAIGATLNAPLAPFAHGVFRF